MTMHVDDWIDSPTVATDPTAYAKFVLSHMRLPAWKQNAFEPWMKQFKLFCTWGGARYRCTGASRLGDVWLSTDLSGERGYEHRVDVLKCSEWGPNP
jgi:hypothetical protein